MKVILIAHVKTLGQKGEIKEVSEGYFHNFLNPRKLAVQATDSQVSHVRAQQAKAVEKLEDMKESAASLKSKLEGKELTLTEKASEAGKLYAQVHGKEIVAALLKEFQVQIPEKNILAEPIKTTGDFPIKVQLHKDVHATFTLHVRAA